MKAHKLLTAGALSLALLFQAAPALAASYDGATTITESTTAVGQTYTSTAGSQNALLVTGGDSVLTNPTVTKAGSPSGRSDDYDFYGTNAAILVNSGASLAVTGGTVTTDGSYANAVYANGTGTIHISDTTITTSSNNSGGVMVTGGGTLTAENLTITTSGGSSAAIRSDKGGGTLTVTGGSYTTNGSGSPAVYSTADITVNDATLTATKSEGIVVEGGNSVTLNNVTLTDTNNTLNGQSTTYKNVFLYQSMSGDASSGGGSFSATESTIITNQGDSFYVTNNTASITLNNNTIVNNDSDGYFLRAQADSWGRSGSNGGKVTLTLDHQDVSGDIYLDSISTLTMVLKNGSSFTGTINGENTAKSISLSIDGTSTVTLTGDSYVTTLSNDGTLNEGGFTLTTGAGSADSGTTDSGTDDFFASNSNGQPPERPEGMGSPDGNGQPPESPEGVGGPDSNGQPPERPEGMGGPDGNGQPPERPEGEGGPDGNGQPPERPEGMGGPDGNGQPPERPEGEDGPNGTGQPPVENVNAAEAPVVQLSAQNVTLNGTAVTPQIYNVNGENYFKLRDIAMLLNATGARFEVVYDESEGIISISTGADYTAVGGELESGADQSRSCVISRQTVRIDGKSVSLPAYNIGGNNYFRLRSLGEVLSFSVDYDAAANTAIITTK